MKTFHVMVMTTRFPHYKVTACPFYLVMLRRYFEPLNIMFQFGTHWWFSNLISSISIIWHSVREVFPSFYLSIDWFLYYSEFFNPFIMNFDFLAVPGQYSGRPFKLIFEFCYVPIILWALTYSLLLTSVPGLSRLFPGIGHFSTEPWFLLENGILKQM